jgi:hypothetical protein
MSSFHGVLLVSHFSPVSRRSVPMSSFRKCAVLVVSAILVASLSTSAQAGFSYLGDFNGTGYTPSGTDLLQTQLASTATVGDFVHGEGVTGVSTLTNGDFGPAGDKSVSGVAAQAAMAGEGESVTYTLDTTANTAGYDISEIDGYSGWSTARYGQRYELFVHHVGDAVGVFTELGGANNIIGWSPSPGSLTTVCTKVACTDTIGVLAGGVDQVEVLFHNDTSWPSNYVAYRELDIMGSPTPTPEPSTLIIASCGLICLLAYAWRKRR